MTRRKATDAVSPIVFTIGHSTHPIEHFLDLLLQHRVAALVDVRSIPRSRRWPQFNQSELEASLNGAGISYHFVPELGGRRHSTENSPHVGWKNKAFQAYADHMDSAEFACGIEKLTSLAGEKRTAFMCAEGLWWKCHRRLISDRLLTIGYQVCHILPDGDLMEHQLPIFAAVTGDRLVYARTA